MKTILAALALWAIIGCTPFKEIQIEMVQAQVIKIDTVQRSTEMIKVITWKDSDDIRYITFVPLKDNEYSLGSSMYVMRRR